MEMQFFVKPGEEMKWFEYWKQHRLAWHTAIGLGKEITDFHDHEKNLHIMQMRQLILSLISHLDLRAGGYSLKNRL